MERVFLRNLKPLFDAIAEEMTLYVQAKVGEYYSFSRYDPSDESEPEFNNIRVSAPVKEFLFPMREVAAVYGGSATEQEIKDFCLEYLANFKVPKKVVFLDSLPTTEDGRINKQNIKKHLLEIYTAGRENNKAEY